MPKKATGWSTTSFRDSGVGGYVPGENNNNGFIPPTNHTSTAFSSTSFRSSGDPGYFPPQNNPSFGGGYPNSATMKDSFDNRFDRGFDNRFDNGFDNRFDNRFDGGFDNRFDNFGTHTATGFSGTSTRSSFDTFDSHHHNSSGTLSNIGTSIMDTLNSTFGGKHTDVGYAGTSTRSSDTFDSTNNSNFSGTSFR